MNRELLLEFITKEIYTYTKSYDRKFYNSTNDSLIEYGENEFLGGKKEAFEEMLHFIKRN